MKKFKIFLISFSLIAYSNFAFAMEKNLNIQQNQIESKKNNQSKKRRKRKKNINNLEYNLTQNQNKLNQENIENLNLNKEENGSAKEKQLENLINNIFKENKNYFEQDSKEKVVSNNGEDEKEDEKEDEILNINFEEQEIKNLVKYLFTKNYFNDSFEQKSKKLLTLLNSEIYNFFEQNFNPKEKENNKEILIELNPDSIENSSLSFILNIKTQKLNENSLNLWIEILNINLECEKQANFNFESYFEKNKKNCFKFNKKTILNPNIKNKDPNVLFVNENNYLNLEFNEKDFTNFENCVYFNALSKENENISNKLNEINKNVKYLIKNFFEKENWFNFFGEEEWFKNLTELKNQDFNYFKKNNNTVIFIKKLNNYSKNTYEDFNIEIEFKKIDKKQILCSFTILNNNTKEKFKFKKNLLIEQPAKNEVQVKKTELKKNEIKKVEDVIKQLIGQNNLNEEIKKLNDYISTICNNMPLHFEKLQEEKINNLLGKTNDLEGYILGIDEMIKKYKQMLYDKYLETENLLETIITIMQSQKKEVEQSKDLCEKSKKNIFTTLLELKELEFLEKYVKNFASESFKKFKNLKKDKKNLMKKIDKLNDLEEKTKKLTDLEKLNKNIISLKYFLFNENSQLKDSKSMTETFLCTPPKNIEKTMEEKINQQNKQFEKVTELFLETIIQMEESEFLEQDTKSFAENISKNFKVLQQEKKSLIEQIEKVTSLKNNEEKIDKLEEIKNLNEKIQYLKNIFVNEFNMLKQSKNVHNEFFSKFKTTNEEKNKKIEEIQKQFEETEKIFSTVLSQIEEIEEKNFLEKNVEIFENNILENFENLQKEKKNLLEEIEEEIEKEKELEKEKEKIANNFEKILELEETEKPYNLENKRKRIFKLTKINNIDKKMQNLKNILIAEANMLQNSKNLFKLIKENKGTEKLNELFKNAGKITSEILNKIEKNGIVYFNHFFNNETNNKIYDHKKNILYTWDEFNNPLIKNTIANLEQQKKINENFYNEYSKYLNLILKTIKTNFPNIKYENIFKNDAYFNDINLNNKTQDLKNIIWFINQNKNFKQLNNELNNKNLKNLQKSLKDVCLSKKIGRYFRVFAEEFGTTAKNNKVKFKEFHNLFEEFLKYYSAFAEVIPIFNKIATTKEKKPDESKLLENFYKSILTNKEVFGENLYEDFSSLFEQFEKFFKDCTKNEKLLLDEKIIKTKTKDLALYNIITNSKNSEFFEFIWDFLDKENVKNEENKDIIIALAEEYKKNLKKEVKKYNKLYNNVYELKEKDDKEQIHKDKIKFLEILKKWKGDPEFIADKEEVTKYFENLNNILNLDIAKENFSKYVKEIDFSTFLEIVNIPYLQENLIKIINLLDNQYFFNSRHKINLKNSPIRFSSKYINPITKIFKFYRNDIGNIQKIYIPLISHFIENILLLLLGEHLNPTYCFLKLNSFNNIQNLEEINFDDEVVKKIKYLENLVENFNVNSIEQAEIELNNLFNLLKTKKSLEEKNNKVEKDIEEKIETTKEFLICKVQTLEFLKCVLQLEQLKNNVINKLISEKKKLKEKKIMQRFLNEVYKGEENYTKYIEKIDRMINKIEEVKTNVNNFFIYMLNDKK